MLSGKGITQDEISENEGEKRYKLNMNDYKEKSIDYIKVN